MSLLDNLRKFLYGSPLTSSIDTGDLLATNEQTQGLIGTGGEMGDGLLQQNFNKMNEGQGLLSNIPEGAILGAALYSQGLKGKDPLAGAFPAFVQAASAKKLLTPKISSQKQVFNKSTGKVEFASDKQIVASKGNLVPALPTKDIVQMPGGGLKISESYGIGGTDGNQKNIDTANEIFNTAQAMNNVANNLFKNLENSKTGFVGESIEFIDSFGSQVKQAADSFGIAQNFEDTGSGAIDAVMTDDFKIAKEAANYGKIKSASINLAYLVARIDEPGGRFTDRDIALKMKEFGFGANPERTMKIMRNAIDLRINNAKNSYKTLTGLEMPSIDGLDKKKKKDEIDIIDPLGIL
tara:strand:+ start:1 stop:1053 length:1053 start_codon:yes stop_codon:yes gene_type:complete